MLLNIILRREPATRRLDWSFAPTPGSKDRFTRQRRFGLPPEFPLASSRQGVDRHLSGLWPLATPESAESYSENTDPGVMRPRTCYCARDLTDGRKEETGAPSATAEAKPKHYCIVWNEQQQA